MNIDIESISLLSLILQDSPKDRQLILCVLARSNSVPTRITFKPSTDYPTFYGYSNSRIPFYLMGKGVLSNVPREGYAKRIISPHYLSYAETVINKAKNWDIHKKLMSVSKFITLDNKTSYKDVEIFLVFREKALEFIGDYAASHKDELTSFLGPELSREIFKLSGLDQQETKQTTNNTSSDEPASTHKYFLTNSDLAESLQRKLSGFINLPEKGFFLGIADYIKYIDENQSCEPILQGIKKQRAEDEEKLHELETKLVKDIEGVAKDLFRKIEKNKISFGTLNQGIEEFHHFMDGKIQSSATYAEALFEHLEEIIEALYQNKYEELTEHLVKVNADNIITGYNVSEHYYPYLDELKHFRSLMNTSLWGAWNQLVLAYLVVHRFREEAEKMQKDFWRQMNFYGLHDEMEKILGNKRDGSQRVHFIQDDYLIHINRIHDYFIEHLSRSIPVTDDKSKSDGEVDEDINTWLKIKNERTIRRMWRLARALNYEWELRDENIFNIPHEKFQKYKITNANDLEALLTSFHKRKFIFVSRKVADQPPSNDPSKPGGMQLWQPVTEDSKMVHLNDTQIEIFPKRFTKLFETLKQLVDDLESKTLEPELNQVSKKKLVTDNEEKYVCGDLEVNISQAYIKYKDNKPLDIQPKNREIKFLVLLIKNQDRVVEYSKIAQEIESTSFVSEETNRAGQYLKRDVRPILKEAGIGDKEISNMIRAVRKTGYMIRAA